MAANGKNGTKRQRAPLLEWASAALGLLILAVMFGFLMMEALKSSERTPPVMVVAAAGFTANPGYYIVEIEVTNRSRTTGAAVQVEGSLNQGGQPVETSTAAFDYVPGLSKRRGGLVFTKDPRQFDLELRVTGYERP